MLGHGQNQLQLCRLLEAARHEAECQLKKAFSSCKTQQEKIRFYQIASHEGFKVAVSDLSKAHGAAAGRAKALEEVRAQHQAEKHKAEQQAARFAKRQAAMLEYESCLANRPYRTARSAGEASRGGSGDTSASSPSGRLASAASCAPLWNGEGGGPKATFYNMAGQLQCEVAPPQIVLAWGDVIFAANWKGKHLALTPASCHIRLVLAGCQKAHLNEDFLLLDVDNHEQTPKKRFGHRSVVLAQLGTICQLGLTCTQRGTGCCWAAIHRAACRSTSVKRQKNKRIL